MAKQNNKATIQIRYGIIALLLLALSAWIFSNLFRTTVVYAEEWNKAADASIPPESAIAPERGNILSADGHIIACNLLVYDICLDLRHNKIDGKPLDQMKLDSLADSLDRYYPRRENLMEMPKDSIRKYSWHTKLNREFAKKRKTRALCLAKKRTTEDFERIRRFPYLKDFEGNGAKCPLYKSERKVRIYPYGRMAMRSIGRVNEDSATRRIHGYSGLEKDLDSLLYGCDGVARSMPMTNGMRRWITREPVRGCDIRTTIDIDIQDVLEESLTRICQDVNAEWGTAVIMEVATGEIKGISNVELLPDGTYGEAINRAVRAYEPGSVMKPISLMIAFEDGLVRSVNDQVSCAPFQRTSDPHGAGMKTMKQVIEQSSNPGIARVIFRGYEQHPERFYDRLASIGFFEKMNSGIYGESTPFVRRLVDRTPGGQPITMTARHLDLARQAYGYNTMIPPLYTLAVYNAIANGGKYVRPHLMRGLTDGEGRDTIFPISYIRDSICSAATAAKVRQCIREVVWGSHGTARLVQDDRVEIAGKTGTAYPVEGGAYNTSKRRYAFCGFFPYEAPKYSCIALILAPAGTSANRTSGQVVKEMALKLYARGMLDSTPADSAAREAARAPLMVRGAEGALSTVGRLLGMEMNRAVKTYDSPGNGGIPDVRGLDIRTAVSRLERLGLRVRVHGQGMVTAQNPAPGSTFRRGDNIILSLRL